MPDDADKFSELIAGQQADETPIDVRVDDDGRLEVAFD